LEPELEEAGAPPVQPPEPAHEAPEEAPPLQDADTPAEAKQESPGSPGRPHRARWPMVLLASLTVLGLALWLVRSTLAPPPEALLPGSEKGSPPMSTPPRSTPSMGVSGRALASTTSRRMRSAPAVLGRYTQAVLPDGRKYPVCIVLGDVDGRMPKSEGSKPGAAVLARDLPVSPVGRWP